LRAKCYWHSVKVSKEIYKTSRFFSLFFPFGKKRQKRGFANDYYRELLTSFFFFRRKKEKEREGKKKKTKRNIDINQH
jgi:hypothetical protein